MPLPWVPRCRTSAHHSAARRVLANPRSTQFGGQCLGRTQYGRLTSHIESIGLPAANRVLFWPARRLERGGKMSAIGGICGPSSTFDVSFAASCGGGGHSGQGGQYGTG